MPADVKAQLRTVRGQTERNAAVVEPDIGRKNAFLLVGQLDSGEVKENLLRRGAFESPGHGVGNPRAIRGKQITGNALPCDNSSFPPGASVYPVSPAKPNIPIQLIH